MVDETSPDELLWKYLHVHGWRLDDAGFVAELAREYPDPEQWPSDLRERFDDCGLRMWGGAIGAARQVEEEGAAALADDLGEMKNLAPSKPGSS